MSDEPSREFRNGYHLMWSFELVGVIAILGSQNGVKIMNEFCLLRMGRHLIFSLISALVRSYPSVYLAVDRM